MLRSSTQTCIRQQFPLSATAMPVLLMQALQQSGDLRTALEDEIQLTALVTSQPDIRRDCIELFVWYQFYQLAGYGHQLCPKCLTHICLSASNKTMALRLITWRPRQHLSAASHLNACPGVVIHTALLSLSAPVSRLASAQAYSHATLTCNTHLQHSPAPQTCTANLHD